MTILCTAFGRIFNTKPAKNLFDLLYCYTFVTHFHGKPFWVGGMNLKVCREGGGEGGVTAPRTLCSTAQACYTPVCSILYSRESTKQTNKQTNLQRQKNYVSNVKIDKMNTMKSSIT